jgi:hypothetical protein
MPSFRLAYRGTRLLICSLSLFWILAFTLSGCSNEEKAPTAQKSAENWTFEKVSGDGQSARVSDTLKSRMMVQLKDGLGEPIFNQAIHFDITSGYGQVFAKPVTTTNTYEVYMPTDWSGKAGVNIQVFGAGMSTIVAIVVSHPTMQVVFTATGQ